MAGMVGGAVAASGTRTIGIGGQPTHRAIAKSTQKHSLLVLESHFSALCFTSMAPRCSKFVRYCVRASFDHNGREHHEYRAAGAEVYHHAVHSKIPAAEMPCTTMSWNTMTPYPMAWTPTPGLTRAFINMPQAVPMSHSPPGPSNDAEAVIRNIRLFQRMEPEQAAKILQDTAAMQGPYED